MNASEGYVRTFVRSHVAHVEFHHPQGNALPSKLLLALSDAISDSGKDPGTRVLVLRSSGEKTFCAGASFDELDSITDLESGKRFFMGFARVINAMRTCPKLIIGRVQGKCVGGGVGLASAVDHCLATDTAGVRLSELAIGIGPFVIGPAVERKIGSSAFSRLAIDAGNWQDAQWAMQQGLYAKTFPTLEALDEAVEDLATTLAGYNPEAMSELKRILWRGTDDWDRLLEERAGISGRLAISEFTRNAMNAFKKRT
jgi:methylglutaconyl-CoA hydratase